MIAFYPSPTLKIKLRNKAQGVWNQTNVHLYLAQLLFRHRSSRTDQSRFTLPPLAWLKLTNAFTAFLIL